MATQEYTSDELAHEVWAPVAGRESTYSVSTLGRVRRESDGPRTHKGRLLTPSGKGYQFVMLSGPPASKKTSIHSIVAAAFLGPRARGLEVNHLDGCKRNNRLSNLEYTTRAGNVAHSFRLGLQVNPRGESNRNSKLTSSDVRDIRRLLSEGVTQADIADRFSVTQCTVSCVKRGVTWVHVV